MVFRPPVLKYQSCLLAATGVFALPSTAWSQQKAFIDIMPEQGLLNSGIMAILFVGAFAFSMWSATWLIRERRQLDNSNRSLALELADLKVHHDRAQAMLDAPDQQIVIWEGRDQPPICRGSLPANTGTPTDAAQFVGFGTWMTAQSAQSFERAVERLRERAEGFDFTVESKSGSMIEVQGRASGSRAFVRFLALAGDKAALAALENQYTQLIQTTDTMKSLLEAIPFPTWLRDSSGQLSWANTAYIGAVGGDTLEAVCEKNEFLLDAGERSQIENIHRAAQDQHTTNHFRKRLPVTIAGDRRMMDVSDVAYEGGSAGLAVDMSEVEEAQSQLRRTLESHTQTMNQLATAVAIFDDKKHLIFYNQAFEKLWQLDSKFLNSEPSNGLMFDAMREAGKVAEQPDWKKWRNDLLRVYEETQPQEHWWHLPDNRTVRVIANPHEQGGVTWVFENITEQLEMESRYISLTQVQGETLDQLNEAIAVFAPDGLLKLSNPSFQKLWQLEDEQVAADTPISSLIELCSEQMENPKIWDAFSTGITGISDQRTNITGRLTLNNDTILDYALVPLPNGQTLLSFADVTANVSLEHTLIERNVALEAAEQLKNAFIEHVSYAFRTPLTSIKGFAEVLEQEVFGPLNEKQSEYVGHITASSNVLHTLVDNLLDLASVEAGIMELDLQQLDLRDTMRTASNEVATQVRDKQLKLSIKQNGGNTKFVADEHRVQQILFNLLTNAVTHSPEGGVIELESRIDEDSVILRVSDAGEGIPEEQWDSVFERFNTRSQAGERRGAGLGLAIVRSLMDLHGGTVEIDTSTSTGASVICRFPRLPKAETSPAVQAAQ
ncbi:MAG: ATP-binding protein [Rhizobiaceae bacterium]